MALSLVVEHRTVTREILTELMFVEALVIDFEETQMEVVWSVGKMQE
jgi:hypothetical protein